MLKATKTTKKSFYPDTYNFIFILNLDDEYKVYLFMIICNQQTINTKNVFFSSFIDTTQKELGNGNKRQKKRGSSHKKKKK